MFSETNINKIFETTSINKIFETNSNFHVKERSTLKTSFDNKFQPHWKDLKRSFKVRQILALFWCLIALTLEWNSAKSLGVTKTLEKIKFAVVWDKLKAKKCFHKQTLTKYLILTLFFMWNSTPWENLNFCFSRVVASINNFSFFTGRLGTRLQFGEVQKLSWYLLIS